MIKKNIKISCQLKKYVYFCIVKQKKTQAMKLDKSNSKEIAIYTIERETEKAVLVNCPVFWNDNCHAKSMWFPKSCVEIHEKVMRVAEFILSRLSSENVYKGYQMCFNQF